MSCVSYCTLCPDSLLLFVLFLFVLFANLIFIIYAYEYDGTLTCRGINPEALTYCIGSSSDFSHIYKPQNLQYVLYTQHSYVLSLTIFINLILIYLIIFQHPRQLYCKFQQNIIIYGFLPGIA